MPRLLLVEDNEVNRECMSRHLHARGFEVVCATDGLQAIELALSIPFDIILMDVGLPYKDGYAVTEELRGAGMTVPIVAITAYAMTYDRERAMAVGCNAFETKPVNFKTLMPTMAALLDEHQGVTHGS